MTRSRLLGALVCAATLVPGTALAATDVVTPSDVDSGGSWYSADTRSPGTGTFEFGPATPPLGAGSFELRTPTASAKVQLLTTEYDGVRIDQIDGLSYSTYRDPSSTGFDAGTAALNIRLDRDGNGSSESYMVYEPYQDMGNAAVLTGVWQNWDAYRGGEAQWWLNTVANPGMCSQAQPCTIDQLLTLFPDATIREAATCGTLASPKAPCPGSLGFNQGSNNPGIVSNADNLTVSVDGASTTYDFEPAISPASKDDCKDGGWQQSNSPVFKNQGECVSSFGPGRNK